MKHSLQASVWRHRDLRLMLPAGAVSAFGDDLVLVVLMLQVYGEGHGPWAVTGLLLCAAVPTVALAPLAGRLVDRCAFRPLAVCSAGWQGGCCIGLVFADPLWAVYALLAALFAGQVVAAPTWMTMLARVVADESEVGRAVSTAQALNVGATVAAPAVAGVLVGSFGFALPLLVDAATFALLAAAAVAVRTHADRPNGAEAPSAGPAYSLRADRLLWPLVTGLCVLVLAGESVNVVEVFLIRDVLGANATVFGLLGGLLALGAAAGSLLAGRTGSDRRRVLHTASAALVLALGIVAAGVSPNLLALAAVWAVLGVTNGVLNANIATLLLTRTPVHARGRAMTTLNALVRTFSLGAMAVGGLAGSALGPRATFVVAGAVASIVAAVLLGHIIRLLRADRDVSGRPAGASLRERHTQRAGAEVS